MSDRPGPNPTVSDDGLLEIIHRAYKPALGTQEIADETSISRQAVGKRLNRLEKEELVESGKFGSTTAWWLTDDGRRHLSKSSSQ